MDVAALYRNEVELSPEDAAVAAEDFAHAQPHWDGASMTVRAFADRSRIWVEVTGTVELILLQMFVPSQGIEVTIESQASPAAFA